MPTNVRDPRAIITPDAFGISPDLLGTPLARPSSRFWAMTIDVVVVGILTAMLRGVGLFVWGALALLLLFVAFRATRGRTTRAVSVLLRVSAGCLGLTILGGVVLVWLLAGLAEDAGGPGRTGVGVSLDALEDAVDETGGAGGMERARLILESIAATRRLGAAQTADEAEAAAFRLVTGLEGVALDREERREILEGLTPADAPWADQADAVYRRVLDRWEASEPTISDPTIFDTIASDTASIADEVAALGDADVLEAYASTLRQDTTAGEALSLRTRLLRERATELLAGDTVTVLAAELADLQEELAEEEAQRREAERRTEQGGNAFVALLRDIWDQLGSAIGLWSVYFTVLLTVFGGQTVGKRLLGIRVVRLDGEAMTWWSAFERAGGYVAGLATGLLGFAQVFWDPNRQCIHDKIIGTVVVDDRAERTPGSWKDAWATSEREPEEET